ncbi:MAG: UDP-N-acetylmuramoyl-L-alanine--D-glutamate ligase [Bacteroidia bacterium]|nr:UDP-N-acetylmuramoyl-L-alanine--D-glutamate ligase [Bacteroidia bacterium]
MKETNSRRVVVIGVGDSGVGAARLAQQKGFHVLVSSPNIIPDKYKQLLIEDKIDFEEESFSEDFILSAQEIIVSREIHHPLPILEQAQAQSIPVVAEVEFAARYTQTKIIAVTGTYGKTTTTLLIYHLLQAAGYDVGMGGNSGKSFAGELIRGDVRDYWVLEVSSFQLRYCQHFNPEIAIVLNIMPDHLDRYENNFQNYINTKFKLIQNLDKDKCFIYFKDNPAIAREVRKRTIPTQLLPISLVDVLDNGAAMRHGALDFAIKKPNRTFLISQADLTLKGKHNMINVMAAILACLKAGVEEPVLRSYFQEFKGVEHRLEEVADIAGVKFVNDSKATNVDAVYYALDSFEEKNHLDWGRRGSWQ